MRRRRSSVASDRTAAVSASALSARSNAASRFARRRAMVSVPRSISADRVSARASSAADASLRPVADARTEAAEVDDEEEASGSELGEVDADAEPDAGISFPPAATREARRGKRCWTICPARSGCR